MIKGIYGFLILFFLFYFGIQFIRTLTGKEKWRLTKTFFYSILCAALSIAVLITIVILF